MGDSYSARDLAAILGISSQAIHKRAIKEEWQFVERANRNGGGLQKVFTVDRLPSDIRHKLYHAQISNQGEVCEVDSDGARAWQQLPEKEKAIALARLEVLRVSERHTARLRSRSLVKKRKWFYRELNDALAKQDDRALIELGIAPERLTSIKANVKKVSYKTEYRWRADYEKAEQELGIGLLGLVRAQRERPGYGVKCLSPEVVAYARQLIVQGRVKLMPTSREADGRMVTVNRTLLWRRLKNKFGEDVLPHPAHFSRFMNRYLAKEQEGLCAVVLPSFWRSNFAIKAGCMSADVEYAGQRWEWDGTPSDVMLQDGRHDIIALIDVYSRDVVFEIERKASAVTVARLMYNGILKMGTPETITTDRGLIFLADHIRSACELLQIDLDIKPAYSPELKPHIESFFGVLTKMLFEAMTWYVGHDPKERRRIEEFHKFEQVFNSRKGEKISCDATSGELREVMNNWLEKIYRVEDHRFADCKLGRSPRVLDRLAASPRRARKISNAEALEDLLSPPIDRVWNSGIEWYGKYMPVDVPSWELAQAYQKQKVRFRPRLTDIGRGTVWEILPDNRTGKLICHVAGPGAGMSYEDFKHAKNKVARRHRERRKAIDLLAPQKSYEQELAEMPAPKVATANFGAAEFDGSHYQELLDFTPGVDRVPERPPDGWLSEEEKERLRSELLEKEQRTEGRQEGGWAGDEGPVSWEQVRELGEAQRYEEVLKGEAMGLLIPKDLKRDARYFEHTPLYEQMKSYFDDKRTMFAMVYGNEKEDG